MDIRVLDDSGTVASAAASFLARRIRDAVRRRGVARIAVSGGSTPAAMFDALVRLDVPWQDVDLHQVDERIAPLGSPDRNATQLETHLLAPLRADGRGPRASAVHLLPVDAADPVRAARRLSTRLAGEAAFDVVHLGIGDDGHTASWPPGTEVPDTDAVVRVGPFNGRERLTLTPHVVNAARCRLVVAAGGSKSWAVERWLLRDPDVPVQRLRRTGTVAILDTAAAASVAPWTTIS